MAGIDRHRSICVHVRQRVFLYLFFVCFLCGAGLGRAARATSGERGARTDGTELCAHTLKVGQVRLSLL